MKLRPDIVIASGNAYLVFDTKWKNLKGNKPNPDDLRQMYTYSKFHKNSTTALLYPGNGDIMESLFVNENSKNENGAICKVFEIPVTNNIRKWQEDICSFLFSEP